MPARRRCRLTLPAGQRVAVRVQTTSSMVLPITLHVPDFAALERFRCCRACPGWVHAVSLVTGSACATSKSCWAATVSCLFLVSSWHWHRGTVTPLIRRADGPLAGPVFSWRRVTATSSIVHSRLTFARIVPPAGRLVSSWHTQGKGPLGGRSKKVPQNGARPPTQGKGHPILLHPGGGPPPTNMFVLVGWGLAVGLCIFRRVHRPRRQHQRHPARLAVRDDHDLRRRRRRLPGQQPDEGRQGLASPAWALLQGQQVQQSALHGAAGADVRHSAEGPQGRADVDRRRRGDPHRIGAVQEVPDRRHTTTMWSSSSPTTCA